MPPSDAVELDVFSVEEIARAAGAAPADVRWLLDAGEAPSARGQYVQFDAAVALVRRLRAAASGRPVPAPLFAGPRPVRRGRRLPALLSGVTHAAVVAGVLIATGLGARSAAVQPSRSELPRLVFLATPGPGGGGGGGGLKQPEPPRQARLTGTAPVPSPVSRSRPAPPPERRAEPRPVLPEPRPAPEPEPPAAAAAVPPVVAPVVSAPADADDDPGLVAAQPATASHGPGAGGGTGTGAGTGSGEGAGAGIGDGTIAGTGGGPYRPGSGITPPSLTREVKPLYTEEARRRGVEGDVLLEVVVRADGSVGSVRLVQGLGGGLDARAIEAVRQWQFLPARRFGTPVDVLVEIAVEFRLR